MARRPEDATIWIGYADFLSTLTILFFVLFVGFAAKVVPAGVGVLIGDVRDARTNNPIAGCAVTVGATRSTVSDSLGRFEMRMDSLQHALNIGLGVTCGDNHGDYTDVVSIAPRDTTLHEVRLVVRTSVTVETLAGDALFSPNAFALRPEAIHTVAEVGRRLRTQLATNEMIAVQGHTDDIPFPTESGKDNWMLSGERAAAAARVLAEVAGVPMCQIAIMGFGPSRPIDAVLPGDSPPVRADKRARNRRIEFRRMSGEGLGGGKCAP